jgi:adenine phosphoribosyltransferase
MTLEERIKNAIRDVPDFPKPGIMFKDITPIMQDPGLCKEMIKAMALALTPMRLQGIAGIESRGFLMGMPLAMELNVPFILIRKKGKLPYKTVCHSYDLEYGSAEIEMHIDAVKPGQRILVHDDLLATGGTAAAAAALLKKQEAVIAGFNFLVGLSFLNGRLSISKYSENISTLVTY